MNIVTIKSPLRISLIGGSSDLDTYLDKYKRGSVISFTPNLFTYISIYNDFLGINSLNKKYIINYSTREEVKTIDCIKNDLVRLAFKNENIEPCSIHMTSDIYSHGSGLAVSSSYSCGLIKALNVLKNNEITEIECGINAYKLEKQINPLLGYQDIFGCCYGGFKKIVFESEKLPVFTFLPSKIFKLFDMYLYFTGSFRNSTDILKDVIVPETDTFNPLVKIAEDLLLSEKYYDFMSIIRDGWNEKKKNCKTILSNPKLLEIDNILSEMKDCVAHKLCGAGGGGFFFCFVNKGTKLSNEFHKIELSNNNIERII